jgi:hypothetical protein
MSIRLQSALLAAAALLVSSGVAAKDDPRSRRFSLLGAAFWPDVSTKVRVDTTGRRLGTTLDLERDLGMSDSETTGIGGARWRIAKRHFLDVEFFRLDVDDVNGAINNFWGNVQYAFNPRIAVFAGYNYYSMDVDLDKDRWHGTLNFSYSGPWLGLTLGFGRRDY